MAKNAAFLDISKIFNEFISTRRLNTLTDAQSCVVAYGLIFVLKTLLSSPKYSKVPNIF